MALMIDCQNIQDFQEIFQLTSVVAAHQNNNTIVKIPGKLELTVLEARKHLEGYLKNRHKKIDDLEKFISDQDSVVVDEEEEMKKNTGKNTEKDKAEKKINYDEPEASIDDYSNNPLTHQWIEKLVDQSMPVVVEPRNTQDVNEFYSEDFIPDLERKGKEFVVWIGAAIPNGEQHASTAFREGFFSQLETRFFEGIPLPCAAHRFMTSIYKYANGTDTQFKSKLSLMHLTQVYHW